MSTLKQPAEIIARALCTHAGHPENIQFEGRPMWQSFLPDATDVLHALDKHGFDLVPPG